MAMGGIPYYWDFIQSGKSMTQNIDAMFFGKDALLKGEFDIIDFIHVYGEEMEKFGDAIEWLPEEEARLQFSDFRGNKDVV